MAKPRRTFVCSDCSTKHSQWTGQCNNCGNWNTLAERSSPNESTRRFGAERAVPLNQVDLTGDGRIASGMGELDRVLGGGLVHGSLILLAGDPGIGKSTLVLSMASNLATSGHSCVYVAAEESGAQIRMRAERMGIMSDSLFVYSDTDIDGALAEAERINAGLVIVDSIQTVRVNSVDSAPGSVTQVRESTLRLLHHAKSTQTPSLIVGHVTKEGTVAGPRTLEHIVDTVLYLEGNDHHTHRLLRSVKNRFGPTFEVAVFEMNPNGLHEVANPSAMLLAGRDASAPGSAVTIVLEGSRPLLVEIQALVAPTAYSLPRRLANGLDVNRLNMLLAVLARSTELGFATHDVYVNVVGGLRLREPATDLAVALAVVSSHREQPVQSRTAAIGEIGLAGELRSVPSTVQRIDEAARLGFDRCVVPSGDNVNQWGTNAVLASNLRSAIDAGLA